MLYPNYASNVNISVKLPNSLQFGIRYVESSLDKTRRLAVGVSEDRDSDFVP